MSLERAKNPNGGAHCRRVNERGFLNRISVEGVVNRENMLSAWKRVKANQGASGIDNITIEKFPKFAQEHWEGIKQSLREGQYQPFP